MKHKELIQAALDGKTIQSGKKGEIIDWQDFATAQVAIYTMALDSSDQYYDYRIKPPELPKITIPLFLSGTRVYLTPMIGCRQVNITVQDSKIISMEEV